MNALPTVLDVFRAHLADPTTCNRNAVECATEAWTYDDLDVVSTGLALHLEASFGARPTVAIIAENLPYTYALYLAVWKLCGIVAPIDPNTPEALLQPMLKKISPTCVLIPSVEERTRRAVLASGFPMDMFTPETTTMTILYQRFMEVADLSPDAYPTPNPTDTAVYLFTSSASDATNIKCVPLTHQTILGQARTMLEWEQRTYPAVALRHLRLLGWAPLSHMFALDDIICHAYLSGGCYIFGLTPSCYVAPRDKTNDEPRDVPGLLLRAMEKHRPESFAGVPWVFEEILNTIQAEPDPARRKALGDVLRNFKMVILGGAPTSEACVRWTKEEQIPLVLAIGMTELGGALFHRVADESVNGWLIEDSLIADAEFTLVGTDGSLNDSEGELYISSKLIARSYLDHDSSAFTVAPDGRITFKTGDRYERAKGRLKWLGRRDDFIILASGERVDPVALERSLDACPAVARSCVVGNNFFRGPAQFLVAFVELKPDAPPAASNMDVSRAIRGVNRSIAPPLRIGWSHVLFLEGGQQIPVNRKGQIWRKKLEALYGDRVAALSGPGPSRDPPLSATSSLPSPPQTLSTYSNSQPSERVVSSEVPTVTNTNENTVREVVFDIVADALQLSSETLEFEAESTFAELGMDSSAAEAIVGKLNGCFGLTLPRNACQTYVNLNALTATIVRRLEGVELDTAIPQRAFRTDETDPLSDVVIVGQALRLPGDLNTPDAFWEALVDMREDLLVPIPSERWDHASFFRAADDPSEEPGDITFDKAGFVDVAHFDNAFFGIPSAEALFVTPEVRLVLETTFQALESANIPSTRLKGSNTGVFVAGGIDYEYMMLLFAAMGFGAYSRFTGAGTTSIAACGRLSYSLDVRGPSISCGTACGGGMVAFDQAVQYLRSGQGETAIVCGANAHTWPGYFSLLSAQQLCSSNSRCATFASDADGYVPAEGAVSFVLKTRRAALRDGDAILAVVKATETKHDGKSQGLVAPDAARQAALQRSLIAAASLSPSDIDFVETHGTGTAFGDLIEIEGINAVFHDSHTVERPLILGAAKTAVGHTELVAGLVGIAKAIKQLATGKVAGLSSVAGSGLNPEIDTGIAPFLIPSHSVALRQRSEMDAAYRALVVAYDFAGTISGTVLEAPPLDIRAELYPESEWMVFALSAKSPDALHKYIQIYLDFCASAPETDFRAICYTSCVGRDLYQHRFVCVAKDLDGLVQRLQDRLSQRQPSSSALPSPRLVLAFPGQGSQFYGMAAPLAERFADFRAILVDAASVASSLVEFDVTALLLGGGRSTAEIDKSAVAQICIFVYQYSVCRFLGNLGIETDAVLGNSVGEISAAVEAGALSYEVGLQFVVARAKILSPDPARAGGMAAVTASEATISRHIHELNLARRVVIAEFSSAEDHVVSGDLNAVRALVSHVKKAGIRATLLNVDQGFHSHCVDSALPELEAWVENHKRDFRPLEIPMFSTVLGEQVAPRQSLQPRYWVDHARNPVYFYQAAAKMQENDLFKNACILDVGPTPMAWAALQSNGIPDATLLTSSAKKGKDQELAFLSALAGLVECGVNPDFLKLFGTGIPKTNLPTYPFQRQHHYPNHIPSRGVFIAPHKRVAPRQSVLVVDESLYKTLHDYQINRQVVLPAAAVVDALMRLSPNHSLHLQFHCSIPLHSPGCIFTVDLAAGDAFVMYDGNTDDKLCSGKLKANAGASSSTFRIPPGLHRPSPVLRGDAVYAPFGEHIQFGPLFRNIALFQAWETYAEGLVILTPSLNPEHDRIRTLDACIHMIGACGFPRNFSAKEGAFLPMAIEGYSMYTEALPSSFICRYRLPVVSERNGHVASTSFEVLARSGELLASCAKYSAVWVDMSISGSSAPTSCAFQQVWIPKRLDTETSHATSKVVFFGRRRAADWMTISGSIPKCFMVDLDVVIRHIDDRGSRSSVSSNDSVSHLLETIDIVPNSVVVLDATGVDGAPESPGFSPFWQKILRLLKALGRNKTHAFTLVVISTTPAPSAAPPVIGPVIQGMLRVFRREVGLENAYGIAFPAELSAATKAEILKTEFRAVRGMLKDNVISYRMTDSGLVRLIPELRPIVGHPAPPPSNGVAVIVGMGSIGTALGPHMLAAGFSIVVYIGRRPAADRQVLAKLATLASDRFAYRQADAADLDALRLALQDVVMAYGAIKVIIHSAAVVEDAKIDSVTGSAFGRVLEPKVRGAYNMNILAEELAPDLESFILLSSISVSLGNPGQIAYVAANSFLDALAAHRRRAGRPGVSLQLGPWESELVDNLPSPSSGDGNALMRTMTHQDGLPLIMEALASPSAVQAIAAVNPEALSRIPAFATDSLFAGLAAPASRANGTFNSTGIAEAIIAIVRDVLQLTDMESLELNEPLTACGLDSIAFAQVRSKVSKRIGVDVPLVFLSDAFTLNDMIVNVQESALRTI
ncbi:hypothetical protein B0H15DRAFT_411968 [Mycena belliarum]|uniref:Polyketide synthase n=1 Tax=Mycena belliarum TaxID=1033014 RepID=A0AAD6UFB5_9AGAR|nr:hypothetical protein B0H15DRAFT_411968 [Mycena belliae]